MTFKPTRAIQPKETCFYFRKQFKFNVRVKDNGIEDYYQTALDVKSGLDLHCLLMDCEMPLIVYGLSMSAKGL